MSLLSPSTIKFTDFFVHFVIYWDASEMNERLKKQHIMMTGHNYGVVDEWSIISTTDYDGDVEKTDYFAISSEDLRQLDFSPYLPPSYISIKRVVRLGFPDRSHVPSPSPLTDLDVELLWLRKCVNDLQQGVSNIVSIAASVRNFEE